MPALAWVLIVGPLGCGSTPGPSRTGSGGGAGTGGQVGPGGTSGSAAGGSAGSNLPDASVGPGPSDAPVGDAPLAPDAADAPGAGAADAPTVSPRDAGGSGDSAPPRDAPAPAPDARAPDAPTTGGTPVCGTCGQDRCAAALAGCQASSACRQCLDRTSVACANDATYAALTSCLCHKDTCLAACQPEARCVAPAGVIVAPTRAEALALHGGLRKLYVGGYKPGPPGSYTAEPVIYVYDADTLALLRSIEGCGVSSRGLVLDEALGRLFTSGSESGQPCVIDTATDTLIQRLDLTAAAGCPIPPGAPPGTVGLADQGHYKLTLDRTRHKLWISRRSRCGYSAEERHRDLYRVDVATLAVTSLADIEGAWSFGALCLDEPGGKLYVTRFHTRDLIEIGGEPPVVTRQRSFAQTSPSGPLQCLVDTVHDRLFVKLHDGAATGDLCVLDRKDLAAGCKLLGRGDWGGLAHDRVADQIYAGVEIEPAEIMVIDGITATATRRRVPRPSTGPGGVTGEDHGVVVNEATGHAFFSSEDYLAVASGPTMPVRLIDHAVPQPRSGGHSVWSMRLDAKTGRLFVVDNTTGPVAPATGDRARTVFVYQDR